MTATDLAISLLESGRLPVYGIDSDTDRALDLIGRVQNALDEGYESAEQANADGYYHTSATVWAAVVAS